MQFVVDKPWIKVINSRYQLGVDGISLPLLILSMLIVIVCIIYSWDHFPEPHNPKAFLALVLLLTVGSTARSSPRTSCSSSSSSSSCCSPCSS